MSTYRQREIGPRGIFRTLSIGIVALSLVTTEGQFVFAQAQQKPIAIIPAEKLKDGWEEIDQRLLFLMVRLANVETSLDAMEKTIASSTRRKTLKSGEGKRADLKNEAMDRKGGGPMKWSDFYGTTAEKFFYHPTDRNSSYHTLTVLNQRGSEADNKVGGGVPASQGVPVHQRPPQFDYIYRSNERARERAEAEASELKGKIEELIARRQRLEVEQAGLWCEVAFRAVSHYDLNKKPLYRFEPLLLTSDPESTQQVGTMKAASSFMALALSIIDEAQKDQAATFSKIRPAVAQARQNLSDGWLELGIDATDRETTEGRFAALAKRLDDVASNLSDSYVVANEGDQAHDQLRKDTFRAMLQESLVSYAQIILALDEMSNLMKTDWKIKPDSKRHIQFVSLSDIEAISANVSVGSDRINQENASAGEPKTKANDWDKIVGVYRPIDADGKKLGDLIIGNDDNGSPVLKRVKDDRITATTKKSERVGDSWIFDWGIDLFVLSVLPNERVLLSVFWKETDNAFGTNTVPNRDPDKVWTFVHIKDDPRNTGQTGNRSAHVKPSAVNKPINLISQFDETHAPPKWKIVKGRKRHADALMVETMDGTSEWLSIDEWPSEYDLKVTFSTLGQNGKNDTHFYLARGRTRYPFVLRRDANKAAILSFWPNDAAKSNGVNLGDHPIGITQMLPTENVSLEFQIRNDSIAAFHRGRQVVIIQNDASVIANPGLSQAGGFAAWHNNTIFHAIELLPVSN